MPDVNYETKQKKIYTNICNGFCGFIFIFYGILVIIPQTSLYNEQKL